MRHYQLNYVAELLN